LNQNNKLIWLFVLALVLRLSYLINGDIPPYDYGDSGLYLQLAENIKHFLLNINDIPNIIRELKGGELGLPEVLVKYGYSSNYNGIPFHLGLFIKGYVYPVIIAGLLLLNLGYLPIIIFQLIVDAAIVVLIYRISKLLFGDRVGLIAGILYLVYLPSFFAATRVLQETNTLFLFLLLIYNLLLFEINKNNKNILWSGFLTAFLGITRPTFKFLIIFIIIVFVFKILYSKPKEYKPLKLLLLSWGLTIVVLWFPFSVGLSKSISIGPSGNAAPILYIGNYYQDNGWVLDTKTDVYRARGKILDVYQANDNSISQKDWYVATFSNIVEDVPGFILFELGKLSRFILSPYNDYRQQFILSHNMIKYLHILVVLLGVLALFILKNDKIIILIPVFTGLMYLIAITALSHTESRYNHSIIPLIIILSSYSINWVITSIDKNKVKPYVGLAVPLLVATLMYYLAFYDNLFHLGIPVGIIRVISPLFYFGSVLLVMLKTIQWTTANYRNIIITFFLLIISIGHYYNPDYQLKLKEWSKSFFGNGEIQRRLIDIPNGLIEQADSVYLMIDMAINQGSGKDIVININGRTIKNEGESPYTSSPYILFSSEKGAGEGSKVNGYKNFFSYNGDAPESQRQWFKFSVDSDNIANTNWVNIKSTSRNLDVTFWGDHIPTQSKNIPLPTFENYETSLWKFIVTGDNRLTKLVPVINTSDLFISPSKSEYKYLLRSAGDNNNLRIKLLLIMQDGSKIIV